MVEHPNIKIDAATIAAKGMTVISGADVSSGVISVTPGAATNTATIPYPTLHRTYLPDFEAEEEAREKAEREADLVVLPTRRPKKVLVAFFDEEDDAEPAWAAYLEATDIDVNLSPLDARDSAMSIRLALVKKFEQ